jgi:hypothetical protein
MLLFLVLPLILETYLKMDLLLLAAAIFIHSRCLALRDSFSGEHARMTQKTLSNTAIADSESTLVNDFRPMKIKYLALSAPDKSPWLLKAFGVCW